MRRALLRHPALSLLGVLRPAAGASGASSFSSQSAGSSGSSSDGAVAAVTAAACTPSCTTTGGSDSSYSETREGPSTSSSGGTCNGGPSHGSGLLTRWAQLQQQRRAAPLLAACVTTSGSGALSTSTHAASRSTPAAASPSASAAAYSTRRPSGLSIRRSNNKASRLAVEDVLGEDWRDQPSSGDAPGDAAGDAEPPQQVTRVDTAIPPLPVNPEPDHWQHIGRVTGPFTVDPQAAFAVVQLGPFQYKVSPDDVILHPKLRGAEVNDVVALSKVLLVGTPEDTTIGRPYIPGAAVIAAVESHFRDAKVHVFKKKPRKRYQNLRGHRSQVTALRVLQILPEGLPAQWGVDPQMAVGGGQQDQQQAGAAAV